MFIFFWFPGFLYFVFNISCNLIKLPSISRKFLLACEIFIIYILMTWLIHLMLSNIHAYVSTLDVLFEYSLNILNIVVFKSNTKQILIYCILIQGASELRGFFSKYPYLCANDVTLYNFHFFHHHFWWNSYL